MYVYQLVLKPQGQYKQNYSFDTFFSSSNVLVVYFGLSEI